MTQTAGYGLCGLRTSAEIRAVGERDARILKGFRCRFSCLTPQAAHDLADNVDLSSVGYIRVEVEALPLR